MKGEEEEKLVSNQPGNAAKKRYRRHELDEEEDNIFKMISSGDEGCVCVLSCSTSLFALHRHVARFDDSLSMLILFAIACL